MLTTLLLSLVLNQAGETATILNQINSRYDATMATAEKEFAEKAKEARQQKKEWLKELMQKVTKEGDLDTAVKIRDQIKELADSEETPRPRVKSKEILAREKLAEQISGTMWRSTDWNNGQGCFIKFNYDGFCRGVVGKNNIVTVDGQWTVANNSIVVIWKNGCADIICLNDSKNQSKSVFSNTMIECKHSIKK